MLGEDCLLIIEVKGLSITLEVQKENLEKQDFCKSDFLVSLVNELGSLSLVNELGQIHLLPSKWIPSNCSCY